MSKHDAAGRSLIGSRVRLESDINEPDSADSALRSRNRRTGTDRKRQKAMREWLRGLGVKVRTGERVPDGLSELLREVVP